MKVTSVFENGGKIPSKYTCDGENVNPPLTISDVPEGTKSLVLIFDDPDALKPAGHVWDHWIVWNIKPDIGTIEENSVPGIEGMNSFGRKTHGGPCPPDGEHKYMFKVYALDIELTLSTESEKADVEHAMQTHILDHAVLSGVYTRN